MQKWVKGTAEFAVSYDGKRYAFPAKEQMDMFLKDPAKYTPALGGDCTVCLVNMEKRVAGSIQHSAIRNKRLFLFPSEEQHKEFSANPEKYDDADLAMKGLCPVCRVEMQQDVAGKPEIAVYYRGMRYLFPGEEQRQMFLANPAKYAVATSHGTAADSGGCGGEPQQGLISITGKSGCAGCEFGVSPVGAPDELGLAVASTDGRVYIVEDAHKRFTQIYEDRFQGLQLKVTGSIIKTEGKFSWIAPKDIAIAE